MRRRWTRQVNVYPSSYCNILQDGLLQLPEASTLPGARRRQTTPYFLSRSVFNFRTEPVLSCRSNSLRTSCTFSLATRAPCPLRHKEARYAALRVARSSSRGAQPIKPARHHKLDLIACSP
jgi:hypothetical protein